MVCFSYVVMKGQKPSWHASRPKCRTISQSSDPSLSLATYTTVSCGLLKLSNERCRWPITEDGPPFTFCGSPSADLGEGQPYCAAHARMAYRKPGEAA